MKVYLIKIWHIFIILNAVLLVAVSTNQAQNAKQTDKSITCKSLFWADEKLGVEVLLIEKQGEKPDYSLLVVSDKEVKVIYRTAVNSIKPTMKELTPIKSKNGRSYFNVLHSFSRTTIWMALDFMVEGKKVDSLTRTFYNSMFEIVPNEQFSKTFGVLTN